MPRNTRPPGTGSDNGTLRDPASIDPFPYFDEPSFSTLKGYGKT